MYNGGGRICLITTMIIYVLSALVRYTTIITFEQILEQTMSLSVRFATPQTQYGMAHTHTHTQTDQHPIDSNCTYIVFYR